MKRVVIPPPRSCGVRGLPQDAIDQLWRDYQRLGSCAAVGRLHGRTGGTIATIFADHGLRARPKSTGILRKGAAGRFIPMRRHTRAEIKGILGTLARGKWSHAVKVPPVLKNEWREWSPAMRSWFVSLQWERQDAEHPEEAMPRGTCSTGVEPFDYTSPRAQEIIHRANAGRPSQKWTQRLFLNSRGVVFEGQLWFWAPEGNQAGGYYRGKWTAEGGRPALHRVLYERHHGPIPAGMTVIHVDGNKNNLAPANLALRSMADCARENQIYKRLAADPRNPRLLGLAKKTLTACHEARRRNLTVHSRERTALLLAHHQRKDSHASPTDPTVFLAQRCALADSETARLNRGRSPAGHRLHQPE